MVKKYNARCENCKFCTIVADDYGVYKEYTPGIGVRIVEKDEGEIRYCTNAQVVGYMRAVFAPFEGVEIALKLERDCKQYKKKRAAPKRRDEGRRELFGR